MCQFSNSNIVCVCRRVSCARGLRDKGIIKGKTKIVLSVLSIMVSLLQASACGVFLLLVHKINCAQNIKF